MSVLRGGRDLPAIDIATYLRRAILAGDAYLPEWLPSKLAKKVLKLSDARWRAALAAGDLGKEAVGRRQEKFVSTAIVRGVLVTNEAYRKTAAEMHRAMMRGRYHTQRQGVNF